MQLIIYWRESDRIYCVYTNPMSSTLIIIGINKEVLLINVRSQDSSGRRNCLSSACAREVKNCHCQPVTGQWPHRRHSPFHKVSLSRQDSLGVGVGPGPGTLPRTRGSWAEVGRRRKLGLGKGKTHSSASSILHNEGSSSFWGDRSDHPDCSLLLHRRSDEVKCLSKWASVCTSVIMLGAEQPSAAQNTCRKKCLPSRWCGNTKGYNRRRSCFDLLPALGCKRSEATSEAEDHVYPTGVPSSRRLRAGHE